MNQIIKIKNNGDENTGYLSVFEANKDIPFEIKRIYYIHDVPKKSKRGMHAHKTLQQLLWCPYGKVEILLKKAESQESFVLDSPEKGLLITKGYWREMTFLTDCSVLCVAASDYYDASDYIWDFDECIKYEKDGNWNE